MYSRYVITFDRLGSWSFGNDFARKALIFGVDNSSSSHTDNRKNNFLVLGEGPTDDINSSIGEAKKKFNINFSNAKKNFASVCIAMVIIVICLLTEKKSIRLKQIIKMLTFCLKFDYVEIEVSLKISVCNFSVDYDAIDKSDILNIHKYLMVNNKIK